MAVAEEPQPVQVDVSKLTPLSPEVISKQATINIGRIQRILDTTTFTKTLLLL